MKAGGHGAWLLAGAILACACVVARGQFAVEPLRTELEGAPGARLQGQFLVSHQRAEPLEVECVFQDHTLARTVTPAWIRFEAGARRVEPGTEVAVPYEITIPADAEGELYGRVAFSEAIPEGRGMLNIRTRLSLPVYVRVTGTERYAGLISEWVAVPSSPARLKARVVNEGNVHVRSQARVTVVDSATGAEVVNRPMHKEATVFYPGQERELVCKLDGELPPGDYRATISVPFPHSERALTRTVEFRVLPSGADESKGEPQS